jgi:hypothetical protein
MMQSWLLQGPEEKQAIYHPLCKMLSVQNVWSLPVSHRKLTKLTTSCQLSAVINKHHKTTPSQEKALSPSPPDEVPNGTEDTRDSGATLSKNIIEKVESDIEEVSAN